MPVLVQMIDEVHEVLRRAVARGRREIAGGLVAPGSVERMLGDRHQLDVREAHVAHVVARARARARGSSGNCRPCAATSRGAPRRSRSARRARCAAPRDAIHSPSLPLPLERPHPRAGRGRELAEEAERIGLLRGEIVPARGDAVLVGLPALGGGHGALPDARAVPARRERILACAPAVPVADHRYLGGVRRPHRKRAPRRPPRAGGTRAHRYSEPWVPSRNR